jgi:hypothetical protein
MKRPAGALHRAAILVYPRPMTRMLRFVTAALLVGLLLLPAAAMGLQDEEHDEVETTQTSVIPTILALTVVVIGGAVVYYLVGIKAKYNVAAE